MDQVKCPKNTTLQIRIYVIVTLQWSIREVSLFQWWMNTHSHCAGTRGSVLIREVSLFQWWMNTHSHCAGTRGSVLIREVSLFQWWMNTHSHYIVLGPGEVS